MVLPCQYCMFLMVTDADVVHAVVVNTMSTLHPTTWNTATWKLFSGLHVELIMYEAVLVTNHNLPKTFWKYLCYLGE